MKFCVPCLFGIEGLCADELKRLGYENVTTLNGQVLFSGEKKDIAKANINIRTGERVLLIIGVNAANTFDELFDAVKAMPWEDYIPADGAFPVKGHSLKSKLQSIPDCQRIIKKAVVERLRAKHKTQTLSETAAKYPIQFAITDDIATLYLDTSGDPLYKRGYRPALSAAPLRETLAAAIVKLSRYKGKEIIYDPFCGSGTIPIEAALAATNRAPGLNRSFIAGSWNLLDKKIWTDAKDEAKSCEYKGDYIIHGSDIDPKYIEAAKANAQRAGVLEYIRFETADAASFNPAQTQSHSTIVMTNPPYGERVMEKSEAEELYRKFGAAVREHKELKMYILSSHTEFERTFGKKATKKRKLYNGMIKCDLFMYF
ncbi:MAG: class I SAM-dependent RNA methyltransferase [Oscillospiraceae bacterium]|nr:class I SAM-dependent RNA methyltransferase [Oscillospiraceae bacterium]